MKFDKLIELINENPHGRGSTSRFRLAGGTIWYKDDDKLFHPVLSHFHTFIVNWRWNLLSNSTPVNMSSRSYNMLSDMAGQAKRAWLQKLGQHGGIDTRQVSLDENSTCKHPAVSITMSFPNRKLMGVKKPTALAAKMLAKGKHPENGTDRIDWSTHNRKERGWGGSLRGISPQEAEQLRKNGGDRYLGCFIEPFENAVSSLAYGAVRKENTLRDMTNPLSQMKMALDTLSDDLMASAGELVGGENGPFAPLTIEDAGDPSPPHNRKFLKLLGEFEALSGRCGAAGSVMKNLLAAPDSACTKSVSISTDSDWNTYYPETIGHLSNLEFDYTRWADTKEGVRANNARSCELLVIHGIPFYDEDEEVKPPVEFTFVEHNNRGFSYYWVRKHKQFYEGILSQIGCSLPDPFGIPPCEWDYLKLAAPFFMEEGDNA